MICYQYNTQKQPPAPFTRVTLRNTVDGTEVRDLPAQLDTAADRTVLPLELVQRLNLSSIGELRIFGIGGADQHWNLHAVEIDWHGLGLHKFEVLAVDHEPWILLGRDVLNFLRITLDGPNLALEIS